jgi:hypothetical protein
MVRITKIANVATYGGIFFSSDGDLAAISVTIMNNYGDLLAERRPKNWSNSIWANVSKVNSTSNDRSLTREKTCTFFGNEKFRGYPHNLSASK